MLITSRFSYSRLYQTMPQGWSQIGGLFYWSYWTLEALPGQWHSRYPGEWLFSCSSLGRVLCICFSLSRFLCKRVFSYITCISNESHWDFYTCIMCLFREKTLCTVVQYAWVSWIKYEYIYNLCNCA